MNTDTIPNKRVHHGRNIKRLRDILGVKQETIATELNMTQQAVSKLEQREEIENELIDKIAKILNIPAEAIKNFDEQIAVNIVANTFNDQVRATAIEHATAEYYSPINCTFNPVEKIVELYERMLKVEQEKVALLEKAVNGKQ